jgi:hypothetical protein
VQLEALDLSFCRFSAGGLKSLTALQNLRSLGLSQTKVTDETMEWVAQLPRLESLSLEYTPVSDAGFARLTGLASLAELHLDHTEITDASVKEPTNLRNLKFVDVYHADLGKVSTACRRPSPAAASWSLDATRRERRTRRALLMAGRDRRRGDVDGSRSRCDPRRRRAVD